MKLIRAGKVKEVYDAGNELVFKFTDNISVFDKIIPSRIPEKGKTLCLTSAFWFDKLNDAGIQNHYISSHENEMRVRKFDILDSPDPTSENYLVPLEFITRYYVAGSLYDRIKSGKQDFRDLGFKSMPEYGQRIPEPVFEITTKFEEYDRKVSMAEAAEIGGVSKEEIEDIKELVLKVDSIIENEVAKRNLIHVDGKKELALGEGREPVIVDTFGTLDEDRWWDKSEYENGKIVQLSKEFVRQYYRDSGYHESLMRARELGEKEPEIAPLPEDMIKKVSKLYVEMYERITGKKYQ